MGITSFSGWPFGLCNSPAIFQKFINVIFKDFIHEGIVLAYMDDLIVSSVNCETSLRNLERVLSVASRNSLAINWKKCNLLRTRVEYLGHVIENGCIRPSEHKTSAIRDFPTPTTIRQVQSFLGLTGYFRKFIAGYSVIARPLTNLLKTEIKLRFDMCEKDFFERLKFMLINKPALNLYRVRAENELHTDASKHGYDAILLQRQRWCHAPNILHERENDSCRGKIYELWTRSSCYCKIVKKIQSISARHSIQNHYRLSYVHFNYVKEKFMHLRGEMGTSAKRI